MKSIFPLFYIIYIYSEKDFKAREEYTTPEILRTNLSAVILKMLALQLGDIANFPLMEHPKTALINDGLRVLSELQAIDIDQHLTPIGRQLAKLPVDPRFARMIIAANQFGCLSEILIIVSGLSVQDPRDWSKENLEKSMQLHRRFYDNQSDFLSLINLWNFYKENKTELSQRKLREFCQKNYLSYLRMQEWFEIFRQLRLICQQQKFSMQKHEGNYSSIHRSLLTGLLSFIGNKSIDKGYQGSYDKDFALHSNSTLFKAQPKWVVVSELIATHKILARFAAKIDVGWLEGLSKHMVKKHYFSPCWDEKREFVMAYEQVSLYGMIIVPKRRVHYEKIDPEKSRKIFIEDGLLENKIKIKFDFLQKNFQLIKKANYFEEKVRRHDLLIGFDRHYQWYDERLPKNITNTHELKSWYHSLSNSQKKQLVFDFSDVVLDYYHNINWSEFPDFWVWQDVSLPLVYRFCIGDENDGISVQIPLLMLAQLNPEPFEWLVPGMLQEKCIMLVKSLSKTTRKLLGPAINVVDDLMKYIDPHELFQAGKSVKIVLEEFCWKTYRVKIKSADWGEIDTHLQMNFQIKNSQGNLCGSGRDLLELKSRFKQHAGFSNDVKPAINQKKVFHDWIFPDLELVMTHVSPGVAVKKFPVLVDVGDGVIVDYCNDPLIAKKTLQIGLLRLMQIKLKLQLSFAKKNLKKNHSFILLFSEFGDFETLFDLLVETVIFSGIDFNKLPKTKKDFMIIFNAIQLFFSEKFHQVSDALEKALVLRKTINIQLKSMKSDYLIEDLSRQLDDLFPSGFLQKVLFEWLLEYPRYLQAIDIRLQKKITNPKQDLSSFLNFQSVWQVYMENTEQLSIDDFYFDEIFWLLQEYRVSLFAQKLGTKKAVSAKRIKEKIESRGDK